MQIQNLFGKNLNKYFRTNYKETYKTHFYLVCDGQFAQCILITSFQGLRALQKEIWKTNFEPSSIKLLQKTHGFPFICAEFWQVIYLMLYNKEH